jgi:hypothetical protein
MKPAILLFSSEMLDSSFKTGQVSQLSTETSEGACKSKYDLGMIAAAKGALNIVSRIILLKRI